MRDDGRSDDGPGLEPGQIWLIEGPAAGSLPALDQRALAGADAVLYDRGLASIVADLLPPGGYAEPLPAEGGDDAPAISARAVKLASEGWSVVQLVAPCRGWRRRLGRAAANARWPGGSGRPAVRLIAKTAASPRSREVLLEELPALVDGSGEDELLSLVVGPLGARSAAALACAINGLAG